MGFGGKFDGKDRQGGKVKSGTLKGKPVDHSFERRTGKPGGGRPSGGFKPERSKFVRTR